MSGLGNYQIYLNWYGENFYNPYKVLVVQAIFIP